MHTEGRDLLPVVRHCADESASIRCAAVPLRRALSSSLSVKFEEPEDVVAKREAQSRPMSGLSSPGGAPSLSPPLSRAATPPAKGLSQVLLRPRELALSFMVWQCDIPGNVCPWFARVATVPAVTSAKVAGTGVGAWHFPGTTCYHARPS